MRNIKLKFLKTLIITTCLFVGTYANATLITSSTISTTGSFYHDVSLINDGIIPAESTQWSNDSNVWWIGIEPTFTLDFGNLYKIDDVLLSVDNNDYYEITWSNDLLSWTNLFSIVPSDGEVTERKGGMDTMSTDLDNHDYITALDFSSVQARYLRITATGGDNLYSIGEFQAYGSLAITKLSAKESTSVPEPSTFAIFALGMIGLASRRFKKKC